VTPWNGKGMLIISKWRSKRVVLAYSWRSMVCSMGKEHGQNRGPTFLKKNKKKHSLIFSRIGFPCKKHLCTMYVYDCSFVHGLFTLHLLDDNSILILKINNNYIMWLKGLKISIIDSPPLSVIQRYYLYLVLLLAFDFSFCK
jgi:hypothetical protein